MVATGYDRLRQVAAGCARRHRLVLGLAIVLGTTSWVIATAATRQDAAPATDRAVVRVDVLAADAEGRPVSDLAAADFEVREDNVAQTVTSVEHIVPAPSELTAEERTDAGAPARLAPGDRTRIVVVFLDTYHTDTASIRAIEPALVRQLDAALAPGDVVAAMTPEMSARDVTFMRRSASAAPALERIREWAARDPSRARDPDEQRYTLCFPGQGASPCPEVVGPNRSAATRAFTPYPGVAAEMASRRHGQRTVQSLLELSKTLRAVNDGRKAVLLLSGGFPLFRENLAMARMVRCSPAEEREERPEKPEKGDKDDEGASQRPRGEGMADVADQTICDADRRRLAELDLQSEFRRMLDVANTSLTSVYPLAIGAPRVSRTRQAAPGGEREAVVAAADGETSLRELALQTDGRALTSLETAQGGVDRMVQDLSSYYLVSYRSSNVKPDGAFRRVDVTTTRRGVTVRARRGYRATTAVELDRQRTDAAMAGQTVLGALGAVPAAIASLQQLKPALPVRTRVAYGPSSGGRVRLWAVAEIDTPTVRQGVWLGGGSVDAALNGADNRALASAEAAMAAGQQSVVLDLGDLEPSQGPTSLLVRLRPRGDDKAMQDVLSLPPFGASGDVGVPLLLRRGSTTGMRFVPTADPQFRRTERLRLELARASPPASVAAVLLDRMGTPIALPLVTSTRAEGGITWAAAEMSLAPLAHGDYVIKLTLDGQVSVTGIRVVP